MRTKARPDRSDLTGINYNARFYSPRIMRFTQPDTIIPDLSNPQSLNRYSYTYNNPVKYTDPTGHIGMLRTNPVIIGAGHTTLEGNTGRPPVGIKGSADYYHRAYNAAMVVVQDLKKRKPKTTVEVAAQIVETTADIYGDYDMMMPTLNDLFIGTTTVGKWAPLHANRHVAPTYSYFTDTGFHTDFRDKGNQIYHSWAYVAAMTEESDFEMAFVFATGANVVHEYAQSTVGTVFQSTSVDLTTGTSWKDHVLSEAAMGIGVCISIECVSPDDLGNLIRNVFGIRGVGSNGRYEDLLIRHGPLAGEPFPFSRP
ncbi:MAG: RHS repeat-associated core domain-containing protein [Chloroflexi bacterium]|nr:RHS repeat-associated core domain-containing protein [Chloroflexota bacterium]